MVSFKTLSAQEITSISKFDSNRELLAIDRSSKIVKIGKEELTAWHRLISYISLGPLAGMRYGFNDITSHLNQYEWAEGVQEEQNTPQYEAYLKVCTLAMNALVSKKDTTLYDNVGEKTQITQPISFMAFFKGQLLNKGKTEVEIKWNPQFQVKHLETILALDFPLSELTTKVTQSYGQLGSWRSQETVLEKEDYLPRLAQGLYINVQQHIRL